MTVLERKGKGCVYFEHNDEIFISLLNGAIILPEASYPNLIDAWDDFGSLMHLSDVITPSIDTDDGKHVKRYIYTGRAYREGESFGEDGSESFTQHDLCVDISQALDATLNLLDRVFSGKSVSRTGAEVSLSEVRAKLLDKICTAIAKNSEMYDLFSLYSKEV